MLAHTDQAGHWLKRFEGSIAEEGSVSAATIQAYKLDIASLNRWAAARQRPLIDLTTADLNAYLNERLENGTNPATLARYVASWRRFYGYLVSRQVLPANPARTVRRLRIVRPKVRLLDDRTIVALLTPPRPDYAFSTAAYRAWRDYSMVWLIYGTDLGVGRIRQLQWSQVDHARQSVHLPGPRGEIRQIALDARLLTILRHVQERLADAGYNVNDTRFVFPTGAGRAMTRQSLWHAVRRWGRQAGVDEPITPTALRQTGLLHKRQRRLLPPTGPADRQAP